MLLRSLYKSLRSNGRFLSAITNYQDPRVSTTNGTRKQNNVEQERTEGGLTEDCRSHSWHAIVRQFVLTNGKAALRGKKDDELYPAETIYF